MVKQQKNSITRRHRWAVGCICVMSVIIIALNVFCLLCTSAEFVNKLFGTNMTCSPVSREDTFLGNALSLIGIAISVWTALNIVNALDKNDVEVLEEQLHSLQVESEKMIAAQQRRTMLQRFEQCSLDLGMKRLTQKISMISELPCAQLSIVMQYYKRIYDLHQNQQNSSALFVSVANEGIEYIEALLKQENITDNVDVRMFLHYCLAEIHFYCAYTSRGGNSFRAAQKALQGYDKALPLFGINLPTYSDEQMKEYPKLQMGQTTTLGSDKVMLAYLCNTYGECCSKIVQAINYGIDEYVSLKTKYTWQIKAVFYCENAAQLAEAAGEPEETYWRNLGCAIEAAYSKFVMTDESIQNRVWEAYDRAMHIGMLKNHIPDKLFYAWLSFYHKCIKDANLREALKNPSQGSMSPRLKYLLNTFNERALIYADIAKEKYSDKVVYRKHHAFALRDAYLRESVHIRRKLKYLKEFKREYSELVQLYATSYDNESKSQDDWDDFMRELKADYDILTLRKSAEEEKVKIRKG